MAKKLSIEHQQVLNNFEQKAVKKYGALWKDYNLGKGGKYKKVNPVAKAMDMTNYRRRMATTTGELIANLMNNAPVDTGYGRANMFRRIDRYNGEIVLGTEGAIGGQMLGAPYMVHINSGRYKTAGWIERSIDDSEQVADSSNMVIWSPIYNYGLCYIRVRANDESDDWFGDIDIEEEFL